MFEKGFEAILEQKWDPPFVKMSSYCSYITMESHDLGIFVCMIFFVFFRLVEGRSPDASGMSALVDETLRHLTSDHMTYFIQWCLMLDLESQLSQSKKTLADIWCKSSVKRYICSF